MMSGAQAYVKAKGLGLSSPLLALPAPPRAGLRRRLPPRGAAAAVKATGGGGQKRDGGGSDSDDSDAQPSVRGRGGSNLAATMAAA